MFGFKLPVSVEGLEAKAELIANVLNDYKVFGNVEGKWLESEIRSFKRMVVAHARDESFTSYLELTYPSCVRLIIETDTVDGVAYFTEIQAYDHPWPNKAMDYEGLNNAILQVQMQDR